MQFKFLENFSNFAMLFMRIGLGLSYMLIHGWSKITGGPETWEGIGSRMSYVGVEFMPVFWGFMASFAEFFGGLLLLLGLFYRPAVALLAITMFVATAYHLGTGDGWGGSAHSLKMAVVFIGMLFMTPGRYSLDRILFK